MSNPYRSKPRGPMLSHMSYLSSLLEAILEVGNSSYDDDIES